MSKITNLFALVLMYISLGMSFWVVLLLLCWTLPQNTFQANAEHYI
jgi:hypothetical protein